MASRQNEQAAPKVDKQKPKKKKVEGKAGPSIVPQHIREAMKKGASDADIKKLMQMHVAAQSEAMTDNSPPVIEGFQTYDMMMDSPGKRLLKFYKENPLVIGGVMCTVSALCYGMYYFYRGDGNRQNLGMRARVSFQGITVAVCLAGAVLAGRTRFMELVFPSQEKEPAPLAEELMATAKFSAQPVPADTPKQ